MEVKRCSPLGTAVAKGLVSWARRQATDGRSARRTVRGRVGKIMQKAWGGGSPRVDYASTPLHTSSRVAHTAHGHMIALQQ